MHTSPSLRRRIALTATATDRREHTRDKRSRDVSPPPVLPPTSTSCDVTSSTPPLLSPTSPSLRAHIHRRHTKESTSSSRHPETTSISNYQALQRAYPGVQAVKVKGNVIPLVRSTFKRASRTARPSVPSTAVRATASARAREIESAFKQAGRTKLTLTESSRRGNGAGLGLGTGLAASTGSGKGPSVRAVREEEQQRTNHVAALKARNVDTKNVDPSWLLNGFAAPQCYDKLVEAGMSSNAVNDSVTKRRETQGAALQSTRVPGRGIGGAAAVQCVQVEVTRALALSESGLPYVSVDPRATNAADVAAMWRLAACGKGGERLAVVSSSTLVYNSLPTKLTAASIRRGARWLAMGEIESELLSERVPSGGHMLISLCRAATGGYEIDAIWACIVIVIFVASDPRTRPLLNDAGLTDIDLQLAVTLETYGRAEVVRRARMAVQKQHSSKASRAKTGAQHACGDDDDGDGGDEGGDDSSGDDGDIWEPAVYAGDDPGAPSNAAKSKPARAVCESHEVHDNSPLTKKKRSTRGFATTATADASSMLRWWFDALRSEYRSVLATLVAQNRSSAREASHDQLLRQAAGSSVGDNRVIQELSASNAVRSAEAFAPLVSRKASDAPVLVGMMKEGKVHVGVVRTPDAASAPVLHAAERVSLDLQPDLRSQIAIAHSTASQALMPRSTDGVLVPGVCERLALLARNARSCDVAACERYVAIETQRAQPTAISGITRSFLSIGTTISVPKATWQAARRLSDEATRLAQTVNERTLPASRGQRQNAAIPTLMSTSTNVEARLEPVCTPCPQLGIGVSVCELVRRLRTGRTRKNEPTKVVLGAAGNSDTHRDAPPINDSEPLPMAVITDFTLTAQQAEGDSAQVAFDAALHICLDGAVRLPELLRKVASQWHARALLYAGANHASFISDLGAVLRAGLAVSAINLSKKVATADTNTWLGLSVWDVYAGGLCNQRRLAEGGAYSGCYTSAVDHGISGHGLSAHYLASDRRQHGSLCLSQQAADQICQRLAEHHHVPVDTDKYTTVPTLARGFPHGLTPGIHSAMSDYADALEATRAITGRENAATTDGLFVLPFSGVTQALAPAVEATADPTIRHGFRVPDQISASTGRSYLADATADDAALLREPLFMRPAQVSVGDNPFNTAYEHMDGFWNAANTLVVMADVARYGASAASMQGERDGKSYTHSSDVLAAVVDHFHARDAPPDELTPLLAWAADACVLIFGALYPSQWSVGAPMVPDVYARAAALQAARMRRGEQPGQLRDLVEAEALADARKRWSAFQRTGQTCAWESVLRPLLVQIEQWRGSHSGVLVPELRNALENAVRGAWFVHSDDGTTPPPHPCPAAHCRSPSEVRRPTLDPRFVYSGENLEHESRGALVGIKPHQLRQLYALMMGAHMQDVHVQVVRNEGDPACSIVTRHPTPDTLCFLYTGGLSLRVSSAADILEKNGAWRSEKSQAPTQCEADEPAYGSLGGKLIGCKQQRSAWDANALLLAPIIAPVAPPLPALRRTRGEFGEASYARARIQEAFEDGAGFITPEINSATSEMRAAAASAFNAMTREYLRSDT